MTGLILLLATATLGVEVELSMSDGSVRAGQLDSLSADSVSVVQHGELQQVPASELRRISFPASPRAAEPPLEVVLSDGSRLKTASFRAVDGVATLKPAGMAEPLSVPSRSLSAASLRPLTGELLSSWSTLVAQPTAADVVMVLRKDNRLQAIEGVLGNIDDTVVRFQFDGEWIDVRRDKVAGIRYATAGAQVEALPRGQLATSDGSRLELQSVQPTEGQLKLLTPNGTELSLNFDQILYIDFAALSTIYLSDLPPEVMHTQPYVQVTSLSEAEQAWFEPQRDRSLSRNVLRARVDGVEREYPKGLGMHSRTEATYRLAGQFRRFLAWAALADTGASGQVTLIISTDNVERYRQVINVGEDAREIDIDLKGANRLHVEVDYSDQSDQGDHLNLCDARLIK